MSHGPRPLRVGDQIQAELADILGRRLKDPRLGFVTVTGVDVTPDLRTARVYVSVLQGEGLPVLERAKGFLRKELGRRIRLRHVPELVFVEDRSAERGRHMEDLLRSIQDDAPTGEDEDA